MNTISTTVKKEDFLKLFTTQLRFQDPLNPLNSTEFTAQLAQFSSLEQLININDNLSSILTYQDSLNNALATNLIGRSVIVNGDKVQLNGDPVNINFVLSEEAANVRLDIYNDSGDLVRSIDLGPQQAGNNTFTWDGRDNYGNTLPDGTYTVEFAATDAEGTSISVSTEIGARVLGITFDEGITYLLLDNGMKVSLSDIKTINEGGV